jgi:predicted DNA-binding helix-hairpin-helix protein
MIDPFGRAITYLRISVTDRCDFRCVYCMAEDMTFLPRADLLSIEELERLAAAFIRLGVRKLRLTGGEPLVRRGVMALAHLIRGISGIRWRVWYKSLILSKSMGANANRARTGLCHTRHDRNYPVSVFSAIRAAQESHCCV